MSSSSSSQSIFPAPSHTRLVTICAHVDHGKTTLADNLIERNGIISERLAGTVRFLDSLEEEQRRGITMRSSAIGLKHEYVPPPGKQKKNAPSGNMIFHLVDSPGHTDFSQEVSSSLQCCDNALLVVDAVEGMCARTHQVLREAYMHQLVPILVINKIDSLCTTLRLEPNEAYVRIRTLLETINAASSAMLTSSQTNNTDTNTDKATDTATNNDNSSNNSPEGKQDDKQEGEEDDEEQLWIFEPSKGNVIFASAYYGWGFSVPSLARSLFRNKVIPLKPLILKSCLFGDFKYRPSDQKVIKLKKQNSETEDTIFAQYALAPLWDMHQGIETAAATVGMNNSNNTGSSDDNNNHKHNKTKNGNNTKITSDTPGMAQVLEAMKMGSTNNNSSSVPTSLDDIQTILTRTGANSEEAIARALIRRYRPLSDEVLDVICDYCPSPQEAIESVRKSALKFDISDDNNNDTTCNDENSIAQIMKQAISTCDPSPNVPTVAHVCKFMATDILHVNDPELIQSEFSGERQRNSSVIMGLARVFSGTLRTGSEYYFMGGGGNNNAQQVVQKNSIRLYLLMGSSFVKVNEVPAGHLCAIYNLEDLQLKTVTLCDRVLPNSGRIPLLCGIQTGIRPLVKVNVECVDTQDIDRLERGLLKLSLADASVEVTANSKGERLLACLGEIHLEQSILDLQNVYCASSSTDNNNNVTDSNGDKASSLIKLRVSDPIVEFGETTDWFFSKSINTTTTASTGTTTTTITDPGDGNYHVNTTEDNIVFEDYETLDYQAFFDNTKKLTTLRQITVPPYNEEEGLVYASRGRTRSIVFGKCAAISLRVVPLVPLVYQCLDQKQVIAGSEDSLWQLGQALYCCPATTTDDADEDKKKAAAAQEILNILCDCLCSLDGNGNAMIESQNITNGICVKGIDTTTTTSNNNGSNVGAGQIYVPTVDTDSTTDNNNKDEDDTAVEKKKDSSSLLTGIKEYECVKQRIRDNGLLCRTSSLGEEEETSKDNNNEVESTSQIIDSDALTIWKNEMRSSAVAGFELAVRAGPICEEPLRSVLVILEGVEIAMKKVAQAPSSSTSNTDPTNNDNGNTSSSSSSPTAATAKQQKKQYHCAKPLNSGMVVASIRSGIRCCLLTRPARLMECHLKLTLHASLNSLGSLYSVLSKRRGKVTEDTMVDGTDLLMITATLPQAESFGISPELYRKTSGQVTAPELVFSHWERFNMDPFWIPTSLEEREDYGEIITNAGDTSTGLDNTAIKYIRQVRERKGLVVDSSRTVVAAEKQRTRKR